MTKNDVVSAIKDEIEKTQERIGLLQIRQLPEDHFTSLRLAGCISGFTIALALVEAIDE